MNKTQSFAQIIVAAIGIFFALRIFSQMLTPLGFLISKPSLKSLGIESTGILILSVLITGIALVAICYVFIYKREPIAKKIVGEEQAVEPGTQIKWLPAAFRLVCIFAGLHCIYVLILRASYMLILYSYYLRSDTDTNMYKTIYTHRIVNLDDAVFFFILLTAAVYLLWGAPHFVRWQMKKTIEQCKKLSEM